MNKSKKNKIIHIIYILAIAMFFFGACASAILVKKANNESKTIEHLEKSQFQYVITLSDGSTYTEKEAFAFAPNMVKNIKVTFNYENDYEGYDANTLYSSLALHAKEGIINDYSTTNYAVISVENSKPVKVSETKTELVFEIDYQEYTTKLKEYISANSLNEESYGKLELIVSSINTEAKKDDKSVLVITLLEDSAVIYTSKNIEKSSSTVLGNSAKKLKLATIGFIGLFGCAVVTFYFYHKLSKMDKYSRSIYYIFAFNRGVLADSDLSKIDTEKYMKVASFKEMLKVQSNLSLPIMYQKNETSCTFVIKTGETGYCYIMNKE